MTLSALNVFFSFMIKLLSLITYAAFFFSISLSDFVTFSM